MNTVLSFHPYSPPMDYSYSPHSNSAGSPLPGIPRRSSSSSRSVSLAPSLSASSISSATASPPHSFASTAQAILVVQPPTPPRVEDGTPEAEGASSSSSGSESYVQMNPRAKRVRTPKMQHLRSPAESTPTPAVFRAKARPELAKGLAFPARESSLETVSGNETPRALSSHPSRAHLHIDLDTLKTPLGSSTNVVRTEGSSRAISAPESAAATIARKKSGEPLKSSLKARRPAVRGDLSIITGTSLASTRSEPTTPSAKSVHFDSRLEHVKLFLAEQKPLAISREGSPTDTSGTESDFPTAIYGSKKAEDKTLTMKLTNMPAVPRPDADLSLEDLSLGEDNSSLVGRVRVRNIAFEKWVAVRFTLDGWQTTSEVTGKYFDSVSGGVFDRFTFTIRLGDMLTRIEEKTLFFALRFNVVGREIWDNNNNENYKVSFAKVARPRPSPSSAASSDSESSLSSLKSKLENVVKGQETVGSFMSGGRTPPTLNASTSLSARYDFATSFKGPWARSPSSASPTKTSHARTVTYPHTASPSQKRAGKAASATFEDSHTARIHALSRGSPRIADPFDLSPLERPAAMALYANSELEDTPIAIMTRKRSGARNHQRGYFDIGLAQTSPSVRRTPPSSAASSPTKSGPSMGMSASSKELAHGGWFLELALAGSQESTPTATSNSESSSPSESPTEDGVFGFGAEVRSGSPAESDSYSMFLNRYCYYTGGSDSLLDVSPEAMQRSHSASSVEEFLSSPPSSGYLLSPGETPTRSSSFDDVMAIGSGAATPTMRNVGFMQVRSPQLVCPAH